MKIVVAVALLLLATACGGDAFLSFPPDANEGGSEASDAAASDSAAVDTSSDAAADACSMVSGHVACKAAMDEFCTRYVACGGGYPDVPTCETALAQNPKYDCSASRFDKNACTADMCVADLKTASCSTVNSSGLTVVCGTFFNQFF